MQEMQKKALVPFALMIWLNVANALEINHIYRSKTGTYKDTTIYLDSGEIMAQSWQTLRAPCKMGHMVLATVRTGLTAGKFT